MRKHKPDLVIAVLTIILMAAGLIVIYAIGPTWAQFQNTSNGGNYSDNYFFTHQLISVVASIVAFAVMYKFPFKWVQKAGMWILLGGFFLCIVLAILGATGSSLANCSLGACRAFRLPMGLGFQPAEIVKLGILAYMSGLIAKRKEEGKLESQEFLVPLAVVMGLMVLFVAVLQKDLGSTVVMIFMVGCMLLVSGMKWRTLGVMAGIIAVLAVLLVVCFPHRMERMMSFSGEGGADTHHINNALIAIGRGGLFGVGIGNSIQATGYLPESINDSVFAIMGETFGFVGLMAVVIGFAVLLMRLLKNAGGLEPSEAERYVVVGVFAWVAGHVIINIMGITGIIPMKGITLPFLSYGGTGMVFLSAAMGLCLQLSGWTKREVSNEDSSGRRGERRARYSSNRRRS